MFINQININYWIKVQFDYWIIHFMNGLLNQQTKSFFHSRIYQSTSNRNAWHALTVSPYANLVPRVLSYLSLHSERERERPWLGLVTWFQNKINSEGGVLNLSLNFLSSSFSPFTQWSRGQDRFAKATTITEIQQISAWTELSSVKRANYQRRNKKLALSQLNRWQQ